MTSFLNLDLDGKTNTKFFIKHIIFSCFWIVGILLFIFRLDILIIENYSNSFKWLKVGIPTIYFLALIISFFFLKWYYIIVFFLYPFLMLFWFIPKSILSVGKIYLFGTYVSKIFFRLSHFKQFLFGVFVFIFSFLFLITIQSNWTRWFAIVSMSYFYIIYIYRFLKNSFNQPILFKANLEDNIKKLIENTNPKESIVVKSFINFKTDEKLSEVERKQKRLKRTIMAQYAIELLTKRLNGYRGRQAYLVSSIFGALVFFLFSIIFCWFLNFQLFKINPTNYAYIGNFPTFDFLYYTLKTITFGNIDTLKPISVIAKVTEILSFFTIGIFILVILFSFFLSMKQEKVKENVKLTTALFNSENLTITKYIQEEFGMEINSAKNEIENIDNSLKNLKSIIDKIF